MAKKVEVRILEFFPQLKRSATWEEAWDLLVESTEIEGELVVVDTAKEKTVKFKILNHGQEVTTLESDFEKVVNTDGTMNLEIPLKTAFDYIIKFRMIRRPRNGKAISTQQVDKLTELRDERDRLTMRIYNWRKDGKDVTELLKQKEALVARIKELA